MVIAPESLVPLVDENDPDDGGDGKTDEDDPLPSGFIIEILDEILDPDIAISNGICVGHSQDIEYTIPKIIKGPPDKSIK